MSDWSSDGCSSGLRPARPPDRGAQAHARRRRCRGRPMSAAPSALSAERRRAMLRTAMGPAIEAALSDPRIVEVMVNPDGALRVDILGEGRVDTDVRIDQDRKSVV